jgi:acetyltransferase-like isoleucine patch superfamily enzyme
MQRIKIIYQICKRSKSSFLIVLIKYLYYKIIKKKNIAAHQRACIEGINNITTVGLLKVGIDAPGFTHNSDLTYLKIDGKAKFSGDFSIGRGCRILVGKNATARFGHNTYINFFTKMVINHRIDIGDNCAISWYCQFLDDDFHHLGYENKVETGANSIRIGDRVWIGANVCIFKGVTIPNGCVVAANSIVRRRFDEENVLIAGSPAKIIKRNITWNM